MERHAFWPVQLFLFVLWVCSSYKGQTYNGQLVTMRTKDGLLNHAQALLTPVIKSIGGGRQPFCCVNGRMTLGLTGAHQQVIVCNESLMLEKLPTCGKSFQEMMKKVDSKKWCNLTEFIMYYDSFSICTEREANNARCFWPNPLAEAFITGIHKQFFSNCTSEKDHWEDPPDEILITLILTPVLLMISMITLVVWCSKRSDILV